MSKKTPICSHGRQSEVSAQGWSVAIFVGNYSCLRQIILIRTSRSNLPTSKWGSCRDHDDHVSGDPDDTIWSMIRDQIQSNYIIICSYVLYNPYFILIVEWSMSTSLFTSFCQCMFVMAVCRNNMTSVCTVSLCKQDIHWFRADCFHCNMQLVFIRVKGDEH